jgi:hypothetical protein
LDRQTHGHDSNPPVPQQSTEKRFEELKGKYGPVLEFIDRRGIDLRALRVQDEKLFIQVAAPARDIEAIWDEIRRIDHALSDVHLDSQPG